MFIFNSKNNFSKKSFLFFFILMSAQEMCAKSVVQEFFDNIAVARNWRDFSNELNFLKRQCSALLGMKYHSWVAPGKKYLASVGLLSDRGAKVFNEFCSRHQLPAGVLTKNLCEKGCDIRRVVNADRMRACIKKYNLHRLHVPQKYLVKKTDGYHVYAERITNYPMVANLSLETVQQLVTLVEQTGYADFHNGNLFFDEKGDIYFIDTEDRSFGIFGKGWKVKECIQSLFRYLNIDHLSRIDSAISDWVTEKMKSFDGESTSSFLPTNQNFDPEDCCLGDVKNYYDLSFGKTGDKAIHYA